VAGFYEIQRALVDLQPREGEQGGATLSGKCKSGNGFITPLLKGLMFVAGFYEIQRALVDLQPREGEQGCAHPLWQLHRRQEGGRHRRH
jgi:hypothetical protein